MYGIQSTGIKPHLIDARLSASPYFMTICGSIVRQRGDNIIVPDEVALLPADHICGICRMKAA